MFYHPRFKVYSIAHGDDFVSTGSVAGLDYLRRTLEGEYEIKNNIIGSDKGDLKELKVLIGIIRFTNGGLEYEADIRQSAVQYEIRVDLTDDEWVPSIGTDDAANAALLQGFLSAQAEDTGWNRVVRAGLDASACAAPASPASSSSAVSPRALRGCLHLLHAGRERGRRQRRGGHSHRSVPG